MSCPEGRGTQSRLRTRSLPDILLTDTPLSRLRPSRVSESRTSSKLPTSALVLPARPMPGSRRAIPLQSMGGRASTTSASTPRRCLRIKTGRAWARRQPAPCSAVASIRSSRDRPGLSGRRARRRVLNRRLPTPDHDKPVEQGAGRPHHLANHCCLCHPLNTARTAVSSCPSGPARVPREGSRRRPRALVFNPSSPKWNPRRAVAIEPGGPASWRPSWPATSHQTTPPTLSPSEMQYGHCCGPGHGG